MNQLLKITFLDYWHAGGSHGQGFHTQATVARDHDGLPYLPGRTLKGLLRDAVSQLIFVKQLPTFVTEDDSKTLCQTLFGKPGCQRTGCLSVGNARLSEPVRQRLTQDCTAQDPLAISQNKSQNKSQENPLKEQLFHVLYSTAIDVTSGVAKARSLRATEVAVPLTLYAELATPSQEYPQWPDIIRASLVFLTTAGSLRHRGMGRLRACLLGEEAL